MKVLNKFELAVNPSTRAVNLLQLNESFFFLEWRTPLCELLLIQKLLLAILKDDFRDFRDSGDADELI